MRILIILLISAGPLCAQGFRGVVSRGARARTGSVIRAVLPLGNGLRPTLVTPGLMSKQGLLNGTPGVSPVIPAAAIHGVPVAALPAAVIIPLAPIEAVPISGKQTAFETLESIGKGINDSDSPRGVSNRLFDNTKDFSSKGTGGGDNRSARKKRSDESQQLGVINEAADMDGKTFGLEDWHFLSFALIGPEKESLPEPSINGEPASGSKLEYKNRVRAVPGKPGRLRQDLSFLALGATPAGSYKIVFPGFSFTIEVVGEKESRKEILEGMQRVMKEVAEKEDPPLGFAPDVPEQVQAMMAPHVSIMNSYFGEIEPRIDEEGIYLTDAERDQIKEDIAGLKGFYSDIIEGRFKRGAGIVAAQLLAREQDFLKRFEAFVRSDPARGKSSAGLTIDSVMNYRRVLGKYLEMASQTDLDRPSSLMTRVYVGAVMSWYRLRMAWINYKALWRVRLWSWGVIKVPPMNEKRKGPEFAENVNAGQIAFLEPVVIAMLPILDETEAYLEESGMDEVEVRARLEDHAYLRDFLKKRVAGDGLVWTPPSMAYHILGKGARELIDDYLLFVDQDPNLERHETKLRLKLARDLDAHLTRSSPRQD